MQVSNFPAIFKANFGRFWRISACFSRFSACFGRISSRPILPDFGRISPVRRESKPIRHESSRIGANRAESVRIREKKKKKQTRSNAQATASYAGAAPLVPRPCFLAGDAVGMGLNLNIRRFVFL